MYGKHYESTYEGSMYGAGVAVFAVWGWVIAHTKKGRVEINPKRLADTLGGTTDEIEEAIKYLTGPDPESRHKAHDGRRMIKEGQFQYFLPSWESYQGIRDQDARREYNKLKQREYRAKKASLTAMEREHQKCLENGDEAGARRCEEMMAATAVAATAVDDVRCPKHGCEFAVLVWMGAGQYHQTENGFFTVQVDGWYCPKCGGGYGGTAPKN